MQTITAPEAGQIWQSAIDPTFRLYIEAISHADDGYEGFTIEACHADDVGREARDGIDIDDDGWRELVAQHGLTLTT